MGQGTSSVNPIYEKPEEIDEIDGKDYTLSIPDECLACIFYSLGSGDRKKCSLVCKRWFYVEGSSRQRLSLDARSDISTAIPGLFSRFDHVTKLALRCDRKMVSINDDALIQIGIYCRNIQKLKLKACRELSDAGVEEFAKRCSNLTKLSCGSCTFGAKGMNAILKYCVGLEELSVKRLRGLAEGNVEAIGPGCAKLKRICLKELYNGKYFGPLIAGSKNLNTLKLFRCSGDWDKLLEVITDHVNGLVEVHLERLQVSDRGLMAISKCLGLEILHLVKTPECTDIGLISIANACKSLRKLHIDGWKTNRIGDEGLSAVARRCSNLQELVLIGLNPTSTSLDLLASNCLSLERLALCGSDTIGDREIGCISAKCVALKKLCIKGCPVSDEGIEYLIGGCPKLVKIKVKKCRGVTCEGADKLKANRGSLAVNLDCMPLTTPNLIVGESSEMAGTSVQGGSTLNASSSSRVSSSLSKAKFSLFAGRNFVACAFLRLSNGSSGSNGS
ncbi:hypothetical protein SUGI_0551130 [Cryptomeria japonica]|uniref:F-box protein At1g47056 n=1 Tax=Cryptomeria japonica TaxID=3369 RepID=UPI002408A1DA|nr:F-box protein At1g47056 [Cryptomeria japonica]GLJ28071.1 hypothetical protein SUGI_0551130 [Cryptomeria japonica]